MHILLYYICPLTFICCCFYGIIENKFNKYKLENISDNLIEINNCENTSDSIRAICLADNTTDIYELNNNNVDNSNNSVVTLIPLDNIIIQE